MILSDTKKREAAAELARQIQEWERNGNTVEVVPTYILNETLPPYSSPAGKQLSVQRRYGVNR